MADESSDRGGQFENLERARRRLSVIIPVTIAMIFALLFIAFGSATNAFLVLMNVPFSVVGGVCFFTCGISISASPRPWVSSVCSAWRVAVQAKVYAPFAQRKLVFEFTVVQPEQYPGVTLHMFVRYPEYGGSTLSLPRRS